MRVRLGWTMPILAGFGTGVVPLLFIWTRGEDVVVAIIQTVIFVVVGGLWVFNVRMYARNFALQATHAAAYMSSRLLHEAGVTETQLLAAVDRVNAETRERTP